MTDRRNPFAAACAAAFLCFPLACGVAVAQAHTVRHHRARHSARHHHAAHHATGFHAFAAENQPLGLPASTKTGKAAHTTSVAASAGSGIIRTLLALALVIALIYGVAWVLRRYRKGREGRASGRGLTSVATLPLGGNRALHLVRAGRDLILVGASEHGVTPIRTYSEQDARAEGLLDGQGEGEDGLGEFRDAAQWRPAGDPESFGATSGAERLLDHLRRMTERT